MANKNRNLNDAARAKKDEFYTQLEDIERELNHEEYRNFFKGKTILCNCDDPYESEFFKYFAMNFNALELKKLIVTCYAGSPVAQTELNFDGGGSLDKVHRNPYAYKVVISEFKDWNGDGREDLEDIKKYILEHSGSWERLKGNGDFRSAECIEILQQADVVVTNPPFSLFREFVAQLIHYKKSFVIIGNINAITYKEIFPLIMKNKIWQGYGFKNMVGFFSAPYEDFATASDHREGLIRNANVTWYTNIPLKKYLEEIPLVFEYSPEKYPKYDNYDAIEVSRVAEIPCDYLPDYLTNENEVNKIERATGYRLPATGSKAEGVTELWECQSRSLTSTTLSNSRLSEQPRAKAKDSPTDYGTEKVELPSRSSTAKESTSGCSSGGKCNGVMGVPITFLDKYNPAQFEILGCTYVYGDCGCHVAGTSWGAKINGKDIYKRLFIRRRA